MFLATAVLAFGCSESEGIVDPDGSVSPLPLTFDPSQGKFGAVPLGQMGQPVVFTMVNIGQATLEPLSIAVGGASPTEFAFLGPGCGSSLAAGLSCTFSVTFTPLAIGQRSAFLEITALKSKSWIFLEGTGAGVGDAGPAGDCRGPGRYEAGKEGSYRPCCPGLTEVFYEKAGYSGDGRCICDSPPLRVYACVQGTCGDGICEAGEAPACGCVADCPNAAWEDPPDAGSDGAGIDASDARTEDAPDAGADVGSTPDSSDGPADAL